MPEISFELKSDYIELFKLLKLVNLAESGGAAKHLIAEGHVQVDGKVETRKACKIRAGQTVALGEESIQIKK